MDLKTLQRALGGEISGGELIAPGPGHTRRDRSMAVRLRADGQSFVIYSHCGDDWQDCDRYIRQMLGWPQWQPGDGHDRDVPRHNVEQFDRHVIEAENEHLPHYTDDEAVRIRRAQALWDNASNPRDTLAEDYLRSRALILTDDIANTVLRFQTACPWRNEDSGDMLFVPALIAVFRSVDNDEITTIQRIALNSDGTKRGRKMLGVVRRTAIKLDPISETLAIGEGVETCLAARQLGYTPVWALGSTANITKFPLIDSVQCLRILGEADQASQRAIKFCSERWIDVGRKVQIVMPDDGCSDLNDELIATNIRKIA